VEVGQMNDRFVEIVSGLLPGDKVVRQGGYSLAFAGGGSVSLKAALDAAHGHEHAADGSELKPEDQARGKGSEHGHDHEEEGHASPLWKIVSGVLFVLLLVSVLGKRRTPPPVGTAPQPVANSEETR
jgi:cobalt-zinc-cadmium efflux system membrane fusion protein